jgi:hypothetical protein
LTFPFGYSLFPTKIGILLQSTFSIHALTAYFLKEFKLLLKEDLKDLGALLENSTYIDDSALTHPRADNIEHFYYYKAELHGRTVRLNVAKEVKHRDSGHIVIKYYLYSINDINE